MSANWSSGAGRSSTGRVRPGRRADVAIDGGRITAIGSDARWRADARRRRATSSHPGSSTSTPTTTPRCSGTRRSPRRASTVSPRWWPATAGSPSRPTRPEHRDLIARTLENVEDMDVAALAAGIPWDFATFPEYLASVERHGARPELRRLRRPHRAPPLRHGRRRLRAGGHARGDHAACRPCCEEALEAGARRLRHQLRPHPPRRRTASRFRAASPTTRARGPARTLGSRRAGRGWRSPPATSAAIDDLYELQLRNRRPVHVRSPAHHAQPDSTAACSKSTGGRGLEGPRSGRRSSPAAARASP